MSDRDKDQETPIGFRRTRERNRKRRQRRQNWVRSGIPAVVDDWKAGILALLGDWKALAKVGFAVGTAGLVFWAVGSAAWESIRFGNPAGPVPTSLERNGGSVEMGSMSDGEKLATLDRQAPVRDSNRIRGYDYWLKKVAEKCHQPQDRVAEMAYRGVQLLKESKGVEMDAYRMLQLMDYSIPTGADPVDCSGVVAIVVAATEPG